MGVWQGALSLLYRIAFSLLKMISFRAFFCVCGISKKKKKTDVSCHETEGGGLEEALGPGKFGSVLKGIWEGRIGNTSTSLPGVGT